MANTTQAGHLLDIPLEVEAVVEGNPLLVSALLELAVGSLVLSGRAAGENVDVLAGQSLLGSGELARANGRRVVRMVNFKGKS
ncbi:MAG TPA: FliM/FliN family flagellar motor switch protein [Bryobacteraceae bacterium]|nr:FliM/FliN family flagellar motor switch protein [Bryobacteraceae bacterium]